MFQENLDFLFETELSALACFVSFVVDTHGLFLVRKSILTQLLEKDISAEAEQSAWAKAYNICCIDRYCGYLL